MTGPRVVLVLDVIECSADEDAGPSRLRLSLAELLALLHNLAQTSVDELGSTVFPLVCEHPTPPMLGLNFELSFGDRALNTAVQIPASFKRPLRVATSHIRPLAGRTWNPRPELGDRYAADEGAQFCGARVAGVRRALETAGNRWKPLETACVSKTVSGEIPPTRVSNPSPSFVLLCLR
jgi:hypothetical protein